MPSPSQDELNAFAILVLRYLDGETTAAELVQLREALAVQPAYRKLFVQVCRVHGDLQELFVPKEAAVGVMAGGGASVGGLSSLDRLGRAQAPNEAEAEKQSSPKPRVDDPGAETLIRGEAGDDTIDPVPKPSGK
jgi:hypothetical protein